MAAAAFCLTATMLEHSPERMCQAASECFLSQEEIDKGYAVMDCGATGSLGGVPALEALMDLRGAPELDFSSRPAYTFGDGEKRTALCRASYHIQAANKGGVFGIHVMPTTTPILAGIEALRAAGAIVDFGRDLCVYQKLDPKNVARLPRASTGHLLMNLGGDLVGEPVMSVEQFCQDMLSRAQGGPELKDAEGME